jgi:hypothetical protein
MLMKNIHEFAEPNSQASVLVKSRNYAREMNTKESAWVLGAEIISEHLSEHLCDQH